MAAPWDVPLAIEGRSTLVRLEKEFREQGNRFELGCTLSRLASFFKHFGAPEGAWAFPSAAKVGAEAVEILREFDDRRELAYALLQSVVPFEAVDSEAILKEALVLAKDVDDLELQGDILYQMTRAGRAFGHTLEEALACYERIDCKLGMAQCYTSIGFGEEPRNLDLLRKALAIYEELGNEKAAQNVKYMLWVSE